jgi:hypothetical protein
VSLGAPRLWLEPLPVAAFCRTRLDEEQARAEAMEHFSVFEQPYYSCAGSRTEPYGDLEWGEEHCDCHLAERKAKRLREIAAMRAVVFSLEQGRLLGPLASDTRPCKFLAAIWSDHPDYDLEWKP